MDAVERAQLFGGQPTTTKPYRHCTPFKLPSDGIVEISPGYTVTLAADAVFTPQCYTPQNSQVEGDETGGVTSIADMRDPFFSSITPQAYATGAATVISWMLVIMLIITPRTSFVGGASGRSGLMGRRGMISGASGGGSIIGVGTRPWLQKVAALTVAVSLTLATADTFKIAERQYEEGFMDAQKLRDQVVAGMEIKVSRIISDIFLWLAQVQTLIRLFPRHKEKVIIKWVGFALILLDITFSCLNSFGPYNDSRRRRFETAIPALNYLFQLSLSMLYAAWVIYYAITKRRYAFYHPMMWNISCVALLSVVAIITPVVFFITDISNYNIAGWSDYFRWVGAAAASVIVWEWVERIEALEREERKDGILGREIFDGDEMLETTPSQEVNWPRPRNHKNASDDLKKQGDGVNTQGADAFTSGSAGNGFSNLAHRFGRTSHQLFQTELQGPRRSIHIPAPTLAHPRSQSAPRPNRDSGTYVPLRDPPPVPTITSPVSRTDTTSADSTVYTIRYHPISGSPALGNTPSVPPNRLRRSFSDSGTQNPRTAATNVDAEKAIEVIPEEQNVIDNRSRWYWQAIANPFRRRGRSPPPEVQRGRVIEPLVVDDVTANIPQRNYTGWALKDRLGTFAAQQGEKFRSKKKAGELPELNLPVTIVPAQPRGRTWSPEVLLHQQQQIPLGQEVSETGASIPTGHEVQGNTSSVEGNNATSHQRSVGTPGTPTTRQWLPTPSSSRVSHVRFTPQAFQGSNARQQQDTPSRAPFQPPFSVTLGTETKDFRPQDSSMADASAEERKNISQEAERHQTPSNHDR